MEMAKYILSILKTNLVVVWSWGFNSPAALSDGLTFRVNGFKHSGIVNVLYIHATDDFSVQLLNNKGEIVKEIRGVYFDELIDIIDHSVERVENYKERVEQEYSRL